jgi:hypothetical protein
MDSWLTNRTSTLAPMLATGGRSASQTAMINEGALRTEAVGTATQTQQAPSIQLRFESRQPLQVQLRRSTQEKIEMAIPSSSGRFVGLFSTSKFWIYDLGVYTSQDDYGLRPPSRLVPLSVGRFENHEGKCKYYYGQPTSVQTISKVIKISQAALSDEFIAICTLDKMVLIFRRPGPCVHSISLAGESVHQILFSPAGSHIVFVSTYAVSKHRAMALMTSEFPLHPPSVDIKTPSRRNQRIQTVGEWESSYLPQQATFSSDGGKMVIGTARDANGDCEIRIFHSISDGEWQHRGACIINLVEMVSKEKVLLTGIQLYHPQAPRIH